MSEELNLLNKDLRENPEVLEEIENEVMEKLLPYSDTKSTENVIETK